MENEGVNNEIGFGKSGVDKEDLLVLLGNPAMYY